MINRMRNHHSSSAGFTLIEMAIASTIAVSMIVFSIYWVKFNAYIDQGRSIGQQYITLSDAVNNYIVTHAQALAKINPACSETTFALDRPTAISQQRQAAVCTLQIAQGKTVANAFQPTASELFNLGFIPTSPTHASGYLQIEVPNARYDNFSGSYVTEADPRFPNPNPAITYPATPFRLFINIELSCLQRGTPNNPNAIPAASIAPSSSGCPSNSTTAFKSLIFNTQKYTDKGKGSNFGSPALFASIIEKIGSDSLSSGLSVPNSTNLGNLFGKNFTISNPIRVIDKTTTPNINVGLGGIIAMRGGYGASYAMQHSRTDGSNPPTSNWDFGAFSLNNLNSMNAVNVNASSRITSPSGDIESLTTSSLLRIPIRIAGNPCNPYIESVATIQNVDLLVCKNNIWTKFSNSGTVDFTKFREFYFSKDAVLVIDCSSLSSCTPATPYIYFLPETNKSTLFTYMATDRFFPVVMKYQPDNDQGNAMGGNSGYEVFNNINIDPNYTVEARFITGFNLTIRFYPIYP